MIQFLVINENKNSVLLPYREKYKLFSDPEKALSYAKSIGYSTIFIEPDLSTPGMKNTSCSGDINISILVLELQK